MRAYEILYEADNRSKIQKLRDVIAHPTTEDTVKAVAQSRLDILLASEPEPMAPRLTVATNLTEEDLDRQYFTGVSVGSLYEALCGLEPAPRRINFLRQGQIQMLVPPPFMGLTKQQYYERIQERCPAARRIHSQMIEGQGYFFTISFL